MKKELFSPMEIDAIGEMMNISLGSSATAVSNLLDQRVDITTPEVTVVEVEDFSIGNLERPWAWRSSMWRVWRAAISCCCAGVTLSNC